MKRLFLLMIVASTLSATGCRNCGGWWGRNVVYSPCCETPCCESGCESGCDSGIPYGDSYGGYPSEGMIVSPGMSAPALPPGSYAPSVVLPPVGPVETTPAPAGR